MRVGNLPRPGETVSGAGHERHGGGKGANQAVAAARLGAEVTMIGRVGEDEAGRRQMEGLAKEGVNVQFVGIDPESATGLALIFVEEGGQNMIAVSPGANHRLGPEHVGEAQASLSAADVVLVQLEVPDATVKEAAVIAPNRFVLNAAPARSLDPGLPLDVIVVNRTELATLTGQPVRTAIPDLARDARTLGHNVVVTLGAEGAVIASEEVTTHVPAPSVAPVDATGAGDAFCGALAVGLGAGDKLEAAVRYGVAAGAAATLKPGAQPSLPYPDAIKRLL